MKKVSVGTGEPSGGHLPEQLHGGVQERPAAEEGDGDEVPPLHPRRRLRLRPGAAQPAQRLLQRRTRRLRAHAQRRRFRSQVLPGERRFHRFV